ncbi:iron-containing alcohol dehydrogenase [Kitasatospora xanthocidica]|uniref:iron-containing alcohol dehydrogenase n=1 Tax=Kitasatospora xanthocidica TaxID=83382 RepID=UPI0015F3071A|nr:iron-containing alcohol dehydrogenase [Kitasatospora xanthocidica]
MSHQITSSLSHRITSSHRITVLDGLPALGPLGGTDVVLSSPRTWQAVRHGFDTGAAEVVTDRQQRPARGPGRVVAVGTGRLLDHAKAVAADAGSALVTVPTALSTDAAFSSVSAHRANGHVEYRETGFPSAVVVDPAVLAAAPPAWHLWGLGDLLSVESALRDRLHHHRVPAGVRAAAAELVQDVLAWAAAPPDLPALARLLARKVELGHGTGGAWLEEGTEHYLGYLLERELDTPHWHGRLLLALLPVCAALQDWPAERSAEFSGALAACGVGPVRGRDLLATGRFRELLLQAHGFCESHGYDNTVLAAPRRTGERLDAALAAWEEGL